MDEVLERLEGLTPGAVAALLDLPLRFGSMEQTVKDGGI